MYGKDNLTKSSWGSSIAYQDQQCWRAFANDWDTNANYGYGFHTLYSSIYAYWNESTQSIWVAPKCGLSTNWWDWDATNHGALGAKLRGDCGSSFSIKCWGYQ